MFNDFKFLTIIALMMAVSTLGSCSSSSTSTGTTDSEEDSSDSTISLTLSTGTTANSVNDLPFVFSPTVTATEGCTAFGGDAETQNCSVTPKGYDLGILAIYLVTCTDDEGTDLVCTSSDVTTITRTEIYNGTQVDMTISDTEADFTGTFTELTEDVTAGGIQIVTSHIKQQFPESTDDDADAILASLQGTTYIICQTDEDEVDAATMETRCGHEEALRGDYLVDLDDDGVFGFIDVDNVTASGIQEADTRPSNYNDYNDENFTANGVCFGGVAGAEEGGDCSEEYTTTASTFYGTPNYFAPLMSFSEVQTFSATTEQTISIEFNVSNSFQWTDGADGPLPSAETCVGAISDQCVAESEDDSDSGSVGVYNPFYDNAFLPQGPSVTVTVTEASE